MKVHHQRYKKTLAFPNKQYEDKSHNRGLIITYSCIIPGDYNFAVHDSEMLSKIYEGTNFGVPGS